ncbi:MAG: integrase core domain-containing protein [Candidatus Methylumidiphilus sp.]
MTARCGPRRPTPSWRYGLPSWAATRRRPAWLLRLGVRAGHGRPCHPQTQGKGGRFHLTLKAELLAHTVFAGPAEAQGRIDAWRGFYNLERPR